MKISYKKTIFYFILSLIFFLNFGMYAKYKQKVFKNNTFQTKSITNQIKTKTSEIKKQQKKSFFSLEKLKNIFKKETSIFYILIFAFLIGILTSFTPCIYPLIPITLGILQTQATQSMTRNFLLASSYVLGISSVYALLGYLAATTTIIFGQWLSNPWLIGFIILIFLYLALSMFGFYEIRMPSFFTKRTTIHVKGSFLYSFIFGMISGTIASPCLTPALAVILAVVAKIGNPFFGFLIMWFFAIGMGTLLIIIGTFSTTLAIIPQAGKWMVEIKKFFGFVLLAMCCYFLQPFFSIWTIYKMYATISLSVAIYYLITAKKNIIKIILGIGLIILFLILLSKGISKRSKFLYTQNLQINSMSLL
ncbi:sulfite exporter TauE/SafE family protein [Candidatus Babeliales bacterium]|nr:sulfite exporter TauE/SafE family protein [Candidatus Babeliales bacterium]